MPLALPPAPTPSADINIVIQEFLQATLAANAASVAANQTRTSLALTLTKPAEQPSDNFFLNQ